MQINNDSDGSTYFVVPTSLRAELFVVYNNHSVPTS